MALGSVTVSFGQKMEYSVSQNTGLSRFSGASSVRATGVTLFWQGDNDYIFITQNPYGSRNSIAYGAAMHAQLVTRAGFLFGAQAGYEILRSRADITTAHNPMDFHSSIAIPAKGSATIIADYIILQPYAGWRLSSGLVDVDVTLGTDIAFNQGLREKSEATPDGMPKIREREDRSESVTDFRPRLGMTAYHGHVGVSLNYSHGLTNYLGDSDGGKPELYMRVLRLGLVYRL